jgi:uncharacterized protein (DUF2252 family)
VDQSVIGNPVHDLLRLGLSQATAARSADLPGVITSRIAGAPPRPIDIKQAVAPVAPKAAGHPVPRDNARRVVEGARHVSPSPGDRMVAARLDGCAVVVRELMPQDLKFDAEHLSELDAVNAAHFLALVVGRAHAAQTDGATRRAWLADLRLSRPKSVDAPSWLWHSIVELLVMHEARYLEHCRRYALEKPLRT